MLRKLTGILTLLLALCTVASAQSNTGNIKGTIVTNDGQPGPFVSVQVKPTDRGTVSNEKGEFSLRKLEPGSYTLYISMIGYEATEQQVQVEANKTASVSVRLNVTDKQLAEVTVTGTQKKDIKNSKYIAKLPIRNLENPQAYSVVGSALMKEQVITNFDDAIKNVPGISKMWSSTGRPADGAGYFSLRGFAVQPTMINGIAGITNGVNDPAYIENLEVIKGPSGTLYGSSLISFGGLINIVTKKPYDSFGGEVSYTAGGYGLNRVSGDINAPLNADKSVVLRTIAAYSSENTWQDAGFRKSMFLAPSLKYSVNDKLTLNLSTVFNTMESTNVPMIFPNRARKLEYNTPAQMANAGFNFNKSYTMNDITYKTPTVSLQATADYKISDKWTSQTVVGRNSATSKGYYSYVMFLGPKDDTLSRYVYQQNSTTISTNIQQNFTGDFKIGNMRNRLVFGLDFLHLQQTDDNSPYLVFDRLDAFKNDANYNKLTRQAVDAKIAASENKGATRGQRNNYTYSAYISDVLNVTDRLLAMASLRVDYYDLKGYKDYISQTTGAGYNQVALSPKFGLIYQVVKDRVSLFANYMNGFKNVAPQTFPLPELQYTMKPQQANQWEGGVKTELANGKLNLTASYYDIKVNNILLPATYTAPDGTVYNYNSQGGVQTSRGFELEVGANPLPGLNITAGYSHNTSNLPEAPANTKGLRPVSAGPVDQANLWVSYTVKSGTLHGLGAGFGGNYASENIVTNTVTTGQFILPSYTILNASVFYDVKKYRIGLKLDNLTNKEYFTGWTTIEQQMPRRFSANVTYRF
ncbi:TonB-dependent receptor [Chitinophaga sp. sic0106]|uniref:TonB-dependent receptor n=1 Tax=Chitinophaga sp. sic0106 TaxID=2854785 RepID=UPI001C472BA0|nr:TonB-dependent receptor [Chitinophaga sp. sic0106]MBV7529463.1 TonB-dependent receptor [Chitinophaga sp. sic0106]